MSQQYRRVNMSEVQRVLDAMNPGEGYTSDYLADATGMDWRRVIFALLRAEDKGLVEVTRPGIYRAKKERNLYWRLRGYDVLRRIAHSRAFQPDMRESEGLAGPDLRHDDRETVPSGDDSPRSRNADDEGGEPAEIRAGIRVGQA